MSDNSLYVDKFYAANSLYEDIVFGSDLQDGMIVLLEDDLLRQHLESIHNDYDRARADECNRWCEVTRLQVIPAHHGALIRFVGVYPDGSMRVRTFAASYAWIVKRQPGGES